MYEEDGMYYLFVKSERNPETIILLSSEYTTGPFRRVEAFDDHMKLIEQGMYEAPTAVKTANGHWCLFLDYYGATDAEGHGYVPFVAETLASGHFIRSDESFSFPYGYKHGTILSITDEEYKRLKQFKKSSSEY